MVREEALHVVVLLAGLDHRRSFVKLRLLEGQLDTLVDKGPWETCFREHLKGGAL